ESLRGHAAEPGQFLGEVNRELLSILGQTTVTVFLSAFYAVIDTVSGAFEYANAGHPTPLHVRRREGEVAPLAGAAGVPGPARGVRDQASDAVGRGRRGVGALLVLYPDGLFEVTGGIDQEPFGEGRLLAAVRRRQALPAGKLFDEVLAEVQQYAGA